MAGQERLVVCTTCRREGWLPDELRDGARLSAALTQRGVAHDIQECFSACSNSCVVTLRGPGRWTYVQGGLDPDHDLEEVIAFARAYQASADGIVPWRERPEVIRKNTIARIPPLED
ncbi:DUF1636 family protein [Pseudogemmobacter faecipullorum]|uniref:DUF1636 domain-containing protein n=1 Tax=Pseudogemmobacter faecipullorum TaxID=2755041 RepID=A0ABS8CMQ6_9RHOB|nr:DUF1636 domain-containing protein [Pseudogemmobacter faecipullorum]MCB5410677.1 DUF1636 domain-containing protein [Pseudogemmobacter faecipullorum]